MKIDTEFFTNNGRAEYFPPKGEKAHNGSRARNTGGVTARHLNAHANAGAVDDES